MEVWTKGKQIMALWTIPDCDYATLIKMCVYAEACSEGMETLKPANASVNWQACENTTFLRWAIRSLPLFAKVDNATFETLVGAYSQIHSLRLTSASNAMYRELERLDRDMPEYQIRTKEIGDRRDHIQNKATEAFMESIKALICFEGVTHTGIPF